MELLPDFFLAKFSGFWLDTFFIIIGLDFFDTIEHTNLHFPSFVKKMNYKQWGFFIY